MSFATADAPPLSPEELASLLKVAAREPPGLVLVGGQALFFWADRYADSPRIGPLLRSAPVLSKDLDFVGGLGAPERGGARHIDLMGELETARRLAREIPGHLTEPGIHEMSACLAQIVCPRPAGELPITIDFLREMIGVDPVDVAKTAVPIEGHLSVMDPVLCMQSRISNVLFEARYQNAHGIHQARVAIGCAHEYVREFLEAGNIEAVLSANERIFRFAKQRASRCAQYAFAPFEAVVVDDRLPEKFRKERYPRMLVAMREQG